MSLSNRALRLLNRLGVPAALRRLARRRPIILTYHGFTDRRDPAGQESASSLHLPIDEFREQILFLRRHYTLVPLARIVEHYRSGATLPDNSVAITMDDGYRSVHTLAFPLLREFDAPASVFLATDFVGGSGPLWHDRVGFSLLHSKRETVEAEVGDRRLALSLRSPADRRRSIKEFAARIKTLDPELRDGWIEHLEERTGAALDLAADGATRYRPLDWSQVRGMLASGLISIGSHTKSHYPLARCRREVVEEELRASKTAIETQTGRPCTLFCYPNGKPGDFSEETGKLLRKAGYLCGLTTVLGLGGKGEDVYALRRLRFASDPDRAAVILSGMVPWMMTLRRVGSGL